MSTKPNIVFFVPDSYRGDVLRHQGNDGAVTPALDRLVEEGGVSYSNAFSQNPVCTPSRCSFMTGWYPHTHGHRSMRNMLKEHEPNLLKVLQKEDYYIWWGGKNDLVRVETHDDYLKYCDVKFNPHGKYQEVMEHTATPGPAEDDPRRGAFYHGVHAQGGEGNAYWDFDTACVLGAVDFIKDRPKDKPFFVYLPLHNPHPAYGVEEMYYGQIDPDALPDRIPTPTETANLPKVLDDMRAIYKADEVTDEMWREVKRIYYAMCTKIDALFGKVVDALKEEDIYDDTLVLFFSDHGDFTGDYSLPEKTHSTMQDCLVNVPLLIKPQKGVDVKQGKREHLAQLLDITATLYDLLEIDPGYAHQGSSLRDSLAGSEEELHDAVFAEVGGRKDEVGFVNTDIYNHPPTSFYQRQGRAAIPHHIAGSHAVMCRTKTHKYVRRFYTGHHELFDLQKDPGETCNLSGKPEAADLEHQMEVRLLDYFMETSDVMPFEVDSRQI